MFLIVVIYSAGKLRVGSAKRIVFKGRIVFIKGRGSRVVSARKSSQRKTEIRSKNFKMSIDVAAGTYTLDSSFPDRPDIHT